MLAAPALKSGGRRGKPARTDSGATGSTGRQYQENLTEILQAASRTKLCFIACLCPNQLKRPDDFDVSWVSSQLDALGLTGVRRLRAAAWPHSSSAE